MTIRRRYPLNDDPQLELCLTAKCDCRNATECKFARCKNCDGCIDQDGKTIEDWIGSGDAEPDRCADCGSVMDRT
jgi:hypothetical protein